MKYIRFGIYLLVGLILIIPILVFPRLIKLKKIECYSQYGICSNEQISVLNQQLSNSLSVAKKSISDNLSKDGLIEDFSIRIKLPNILRIDLVLTKPKYALFNKNQNKYLLIDNKGQILSIDDNTNLPKVIISEDVEKVSPISSKYIFALEMIYNLYYLNQIREGEIIDNSLVVNTIDNLRVIFPLDGEKDVLLGSMRLIFSRLNNTQVPLKIERVKEIDLRYKNPVLRY